jgi:fucose permease
MREIGEGAELDDINEEAKKGHFQQIMRLRAVHLLAAFIILYVGTEVTIGGWIVTFIIQERGGGPSSGTSQVFVILIDQYSTSTSDL